MGVFRFLYILIILVSSLFFISCGDEESDNSNSVSSSKSKYLNVSKAPSNSPVSIFQNISLEFSAELNVSSVNSSSAYIVDSQNQVFGSRVEVDELNSSKITFIPYKYFSPASAYTIIITTDIQDILGRRLSENFYHPFVTETEDIDTTSLFIKSIKPSANRIDIDISNDFYIEFNRFIAQDSVSDSSVIELKDSSGNVVDGTSKVFNSTISFIPTQDLNETETYTLSLTSNISDMFGNTYSIDSDTNVSSWSFTTTDSINSYSKDGISRISETDLAKSSYIVRTLKQGTTDSVIVVGTIKGLELYKINYVVPFTKPTIELLYRYDLPSKVNSLATFSDSFIVAATKADGIYSFEATDTNLSEKSHIPLSESIYSVSLGMASDGTVDKAYAVGPKYGLGIYTLSQDGTIQLLNKIDQNNSVMVDVVDAAAYDEISMSDKRRIYVADYNDAMLIYDENGTLESKVDLNSSTRKVIALKDYMGYISGIVAISSTGIVKSFDMNGTARSYGNMELPIKTSNSYTHTDSINMISKTLINDTNRGLAILDSSSSFYPEALVLYEDGAISSSVVSDSVNYISYIVALSENGKLGIYNIYADTSNPYIVSTTPNEGDTVEANSSLSVTIQDDNLDFATLNESNFQILDLISSKTIAYDLNVSGNDYSATCVLTPQTPLEDGNYSFIVKRSITDIVGNKVNNGIDHEVNFNVQSVIPTISVSDITVYENNATASFIVSLSESVSQDVSFDYVTSDSSATAGSDYTFSSGTATILANATSTTIDVSLINDYASEDNETFILTLSNPSSNATFLTSSAIATIIDDTTGVVDLTLSGDANVTEGSSANYTLTLSQPASTDLNVSLNLIDVDTSSLDIGSISPYYTILAGETNTSFAIPTIDNNISDANKTYSVAISATNGGNIESLNVDSTAVTTTIVDDANDIVTLTLSGAVNATEGNDVNYTITLSQPAVTDLNIDVNLTHIDTNTSDISGFGSYYTIPAGQSSTTITLSALDNNISENNETYTLALAGTYNGGGFENLSIDTTAITTTIIDEDISSLSIADSTVYEDAGVMKFTISVDNVSESNITFGYTTVDINATAGTDYTELNSTTTLLAGETSVDINVSISNDTSPEGSETFAINIIDESSDANLNVTDRSAVGTIVDELAISNDDNVSGLEGNTISGNLLDNDIGDAIQIVTFSRDFDVNVTTYSVGDSSSADGYCDFTIDANGNFTLQPTAGSIDNYGTVNISYTTSLGTDANLTINIANDNNDAYSDTAIADSNITIDMFANDESNIVSLVSAEASGGYLTSQIDGNTTVGLTVTEGTSTVANGGDGQITFTYIGNGVYNVLSQDFSDNNITITYTTNTGSSSTANFLLLIGGQ